MTESRNDRIRIAAMELIAAAETAGSSGQYVVLTTDPQLLNTHNHGMTAYGPFPEMEAMEQADKLAQVMASLPDTADITVSLVPWAPHA